MLELSITVLIVIVGSALCSGSEAALFSVSEIKIRQLAEAGLARARTLLHIKERMSRPISTIVILNNIFNIVGSILVGAIAARELGSQWVGVFSGVLTMGVIIGSEIIPKNLGERYAEPISLAVAGPVMLLTKVMFPLVWLIERIVSPITKGAPRMTTNEAEIALLAQIGQQEGTIERDEAALIQRVFRLNDTTACMLMTPRVSLTYLRGDQTLAEARERIIDSPHTRMLVIGESIDDVLGIARKGVLLVAIVEGDTNKLISELAQPAQFIPEMVRADKLLQTFRETHEHLAVVVDEFGGVAGVITLEDVVEVLTGEIVDETDLVVDMQELARQRRKKLFPMQEQEDENRA